MIMVDMPIAFAAQLRVINDSTQITRDCDKSRRGIAGAMRQGQGVYLAGQVTESSASQRLLCEAGASFTVGSHRVWSC